MVMKRVLIIDDDVDMCSLLSRYLQKKGFEVESAHNGAKGIAKFKESKFDLVLSDFRLGDREGNQVLRDIKAINPAAIVIIITGYSDIKTAVDVIKAGAFDYITKPLIPDEVLNVITKALNQQSNPESQSGKQSSGSQSEADNESFLVGHAPATKEIYKQIDLVAPTNYSIILYGESGTGKEVIARTIHQKSLRKDKPFVAMDCGTLSKELAGSELFGHVKGAFTGALTDKEGHFELANGGTLFLDEVANLSYEIQAALLRVIQERKYRRVGGTKEMDVDVRIIVASNENLLDAYKKGKFREDLFHRFNEFSMILPRLQERKQDIPLFAEFFLTKSNGELNKDVEGFEDEVMEVFLNYSWPGNLREFRNVIRRSALLTTSALVNTSVLPAEIINSTLLKHADDRHSFDNSHHQNEHKEIDLKNSAAEAEYNVIMTVLKQVNYNKTKAAEILKIDRKTLYNKIKAYQLE
jgi:two-component system, NtrC family, response regulator HydG